MVKLFISSVQREFEAERREVAAYIRQDAVMGRFFEPFLFEELPAKDVSAQQAYLTEVAETDVYLGLFGVDYGYDMRTRRAFRLRSGSMTVPRRTTSTESY